MFVAICEQSHPFCKSFADRCKEKFQNLMAETMSIEAVVEKVPCNAGRVS